jgi:hypothetical protein
MRMSPAGVANGILRQSVQRGPTVQERNYRRFLLFLALGFVLEMNAQAAAATEVKGTIKVAGAKANPPAPPITKCDELEVLATSQARQKCGEPICLLPAWQHHANATGNWSSGSCSYVVKVVAESEFNVSVYPSDNAPTCRGWLYVTTTPAESGGLKVSSGDSKDQNFTLDSIGCAPPPP